MSEKEYDIIFLGAGPAGYQGAIRAAQLGAKVAVVEERKVGGVCLNKGCIPTKTLNASVEMLRHLRNAGKFGLHAGSFTVDFQEIIGRRDKVISLLRGGVEFLFRERGVHLVRGKGKIISRDSIQVEGNDKIELLKGKALIIATGSRPARPSSFPSNSPFVLDTEDWFNLREVPESLLVVGGGAVGVEFASIFAELGSKVTIVEMMERLLPGEDRDLSAQLERSFKRRKIRIITSAKVDALRYEGERAKVLLSQGEEMEASRILLCTGRIPNIEGIGLEGIGVSTSKGWVSVNERMETNLPGIYAAGDITGGILLAHVAFAEGIVAAENALGAQKSMSYHAVPRCIFANPEIAAVGMTEDEAKGEYPIKVSTFPLKSLGVAQALGEWEGLVKMIAHAETDEVLGVHIAGHQASALIAEAALAIQAGLKVKEIEETIHAHPTMPEALLETAQAIHDRAIHIPTSVQHKS
ncbi:MAG: dihydrolipoyl dehydrogenase [Proteobacteria bacterium]|nr:dihydrolipoyl dehydrogenase [Pseudomonadota bacterium]